MANTRPTSTEELWMICYFEELKDTGFIKTIEYQPDPIILTNKVDINIHKKMVTKIKKSKKTLLRPHIYTPDFLITWNGANIFHESIDNDYFYKTPEFFSFMNRSFIEVKGIFDRNNMTRLFTTRTQPWIWQRHELYINLIKIPQIFKNTFIPNSILDQFYYKKRTKKNSIGDKKYNWDYKTIENYLNH